MHLPILLTAFAASLATAAPSAPTQLLFESPAAGVPSLQSLHLSPAHLAAMQHHIASLPEKRLIKLSEAAVPIEITEGEKALLVFERTRFVDVTDERTFAGVRDKEVYADKVRLASSGREGRALIGSCEQVAYSAKDLDKVMKHIDLDYMEAFLRNFTSFR